MCSITGLYINKNCDEDEFSFLKEIMATAELRGRDSFGIAFLGEYKQQLVREICKPTEALKSINYDSTLIGGSKVIINNNRAEPTTEYVEQKKVSDVQPFSYKETFIVHNGTIANDKDLEKKYNLTRDTKIDSAVIPALLNTQWDGYQIDTLIKLLVDDLIGSYALAIWDKRNPNTLFLATNYKPLFLIQNLKSGNLLFTSFEDYLNFGSIEKYFSSNYRIRAIQPYTLVKISSGLQITEYSLYKKDIEGQKGKHALVIASSGLDSTVSASWALSQGYKITLLHFKYHCRAESKELESIKNIANFYNCDLVEIPVSFFKDTIKHSRLTNPEQSGDIVKTNKGEASAELALEWVPARNLIFMSIAAGFAEANKMDYIILGGNLEESGSYADNELIFQKKFNSLLPHALNLQNKVEVLTPVANLMKHEIIKMGIELGAPLHLTWSCYESGEKPCGECGPDFMRRVGFKMNHVRDMQEYLKEDEDFWKGCDEVILQNDKWVQNDKEIK